jgi:hypothetical protein
MDAHKKKVHCHICGKDFSGPKSLRVHDNTKHTDQSTPEAIARRLKHNTDTSRRRRERRATDPIYREKMQTNNRIERSNKNARKAAEDGGHVGGVADVDEMDVHISDDDNVIEVIQEDASEDSDLADGLRDDTQSKDVVSSVGDVVVVDDDSGHVGGASKQEKKSDMKRKNTGVLHATTMLLTAANVSEFFEPKYPVPRSKAQRLLEPRG